MAFDPFVAIRLTPPFARQTGWPERFGPVFAARGFRTRNPTPREFVTAVRLSDALFLAARNARGCRPPGVTGRVPVPRLECLCRTR